MILGENGIEDFEVENNTCKTIYELSSSSDFKRAFTVILDTYSLYSTEYILSIFDKIHSNTTLEKIEVSDYEDFLNNSELHDKISTLIGRMIGLNTTNSTSFLEDFSCKDIVDNEIALSQRDIIRVLDNHSTITVVNECNNYNKVCYTDKLGQRSYTYCIFGEEDRLEKKDFFDEVGEIMEIKGKKYFQAHIGLKTGLIELGKEYDFSNKVIFDEITVSTKFPGFMKAKQGNNEGVIKIGDEDRSSECIKFDQVRIKFIYEGRLYYRAQYEGSSSITELDKNQNIISHNQYCPAGFIQYGSENSSDINGDAHDLSNLRKQDSCVIFEHAKGISGWDANGEFSNSDKGEVLEDTVIFEGKIFGIGKKGKKYCVSQLGTTEISEEVYNNIISIYIDSGNLYIDTKNHIFSKRKKRLVKKATPPQSDANSGVSVSREYA